MPAISLLSRLLRRNAPAVPGALYAALADTHAVAELAADGTVLRASAGYLALTGGNVDALRARHREATTGADGVASAVGPWAAPSGDAHVASPTRVFEVSRDGEVLWLESTVIEVAAGAAVPSRAVEIVRDVTAQTREARDLAARCEALERSMAVVEFALDGTILRANDNFLAVTGYTGAEVVGRHHSMFVEPATARGEEYRLFWQALNAGELRAGQFRRRARGGRDVWIEASYNPVLDADGKPYKVVKFATDVTAQRNRNADREGQITALHKVQAVIEFELDGTICTANANFLRAAGYEEADIVGRHHSMFVDPVERDSDAYRAFWSKLGRGEADTGRYRRIRRDGSDLWLQASYNPILDAAGRPYRVVKYCTDITAEVEQAAALEALLARVQGFSASLREGALAIAAGSGDLSQRTVEQEVALEQTAADMHALAAAITQTAGHAAQASRLAGGAADAAQGGASAVERVVAAMDDIAAGSRKVAGLAGVIDSIAFQTNILALNAAVEAARAGEAGRGFAVVAGEVRALAQRCSTSARDIRRSLQAADEAVATGSARAVDAGQAVRELARMIELTSGMMADITAATREQTRRVDQVNRSLGGMEEGTRRNTALVEHLAGTSQQFDAVSSGLHMAVSSFAAKDVAATA